MASHGFQRVGQQVFSNPVLWKRVLIGDFAERFRLVSEVARVSWGYLRVCFGLLWLLRYGTPPVVNLEICPAPEYSLYSFFLGTFLCSFLL